MPPKRKSGGPAASTRGAQSRLSFNSKKAGVTKPSKSSTPASKDLTKKLTGIEHDAAQDEPEVEEEKVQLIVPEHDDDNGEPEPEREEVEVKGVRAEIVRVPPPQKKKSKKQDEKTAREVEAEKLSDAAIKRYWKAEEESRIAPRVHQKDLSQSEKILRHFDLSSQYGPCIGISRMKRWKRAETLGLKPPVEVLAVLMREEEADNKRKKGVEEGKWKRAYLDELMEGRTAIVE